MIHTIFGCELIIKSNEYRDGRMYFSYTATMPQCGAVFFGSNFSPSPRRDDPTGMVAALELLAWLTLQEGDTDAEFFDEYTPDQLAWAATFECECIKGAVDEVIVLSDIEGIARLSGTDQYGAVWSEFDAEYTDEDEQETCSICEADLPSGWVCLDDGSQAVCSDHIYFADQEEARRLGRTWIGDRLVNA